MDLSNEEKEFEHLRLKEVRSVLVENIKYLDQRVSEEHHRVIDQKRKIIQSRETEQVDQAQEIQKFYHYNQDLIHDYGALKKFRELYHSPYFARIDFRKEGQTDRIYIGLGSLMDAENKNILIYDWRTPISSIFYEYELGPVIYESNRGPIEGELLLKRQYKIIDGKIVYMFNTNLKIDDEMLQEILGKSKSGQMEQIVTTIQREQNRIIRDDDCDLLIVQGPAGSGKTSIALHRVAFLLYKYRQELDASNMAIFSPNRLFSDYISRVLPELGEENIRQYTFYDCVDDYLKPYLKNQEMESPISQLEYIYSQRVNENDTDNVRIKCIEYKNSSEFYNLIKSYADYLEEQRMEFKTIKYLNQVIITEDELHKLWSNSYSFLPVGRRFKKLKRKILYKIRPIKMKRFKELKNKLKRENPEYSILSESVLTRASIKELRDELQPLKNMINKWDNIKLISTYKELFSDDEIWSESISKSPEVNVCNANGEFSISDVAAIKEYTSNSLKSNVYYEDFVPLVYLRLRLWGNQDRELLKIKYVLIDEAQDYSLLHYEIFRLIMPKSRFTILGDINQLIHPYQGINKYQGIADIFTVKESMKMELGKSYRSTPQIMEFASALLPGKQMISAVNRAGFIPEVTVTDEKGQYEIIKSSIYELEEAGAKSIAVVGKTAKSCQEMYLQLNQIDIKMLSADEDKYIGGKVLLPSYLVKGLEFDAVIIVIDELNKYQDDEQHLFYTICTRALNHLKIFSCGQMPPLIMQIDKSKYIYELKVN